MSGNPEHEPSPRQGISLDELAQAFAQVMGRPPSCGRRGPGGRLAASSGAERCAVARRANAGRTPPAGRRRESRRRLLPLGSAEHPGSDALRRQPEQPVAFRRRGRPVDARCRAATKSPSWSRAQARYAAARLSLQDRPRRRRLSPPASQRVSSAWPIVLGRLRQARLSQAAIDVLAIVAYQQP